MAEQEGPDGGDDALDDGKLGVLLDQVGEQLVVDRGLGGAVRDRRAGGERRRVAVRLHALHLRDDVLVLLGPDHALQAKMSSDLVQKHARRVRGREVVGDHPGRVGPFPRQWVARRIVDAPDPAFAIVQVRGQLRLVLYYPQDLGLDEPANACAEAA